jgi:uncharacterized membrane protein
MLQHLIGSLSLCRFRNAHFIFLVIFLKSCVSDSEEDINPSIPDEEMCAEVISFAGEIQPVINMGCIIPACHNGDLGSSLDYSDFETFQSRAVQVKNRVNSGSMPPPNSGITLTDEEKELISCWVDQGAQNN